jgi:nicotinamide mononucleotide transporter
LNELVDQIIKSAKDAPALEIIAVVFGIVSVILSRKEHIWVFPTGLINTIIYTYLCYAVWDLYAEASVNLFYTGMSIYGWVIWARKQEGQPALQISWNKKIEQVLSIAFFFLCWGVLFLVLNYHSNSTVPVADSFASAAAYTGMLLMARKKVESWIWWIITNIACIPLYFYKAAVFTSFQYLIFLILAVMGLITWRKKAAAIAVKTHN